MKSFLVVAAILGLVAADVSHLTGYHYKVPQTSYGVPTHQGSTGYTGHNRPTGQQYPGQGYQGQVSQFGQQQNGGNYQTVNQGYKNAAQSGLGSQGPQYQGAHYHGNQQQSGYQSGVGNAQQSAYQTAAQYQSAGQALAGLQAPSQGYFQRQSGQAGHNYQQQYQSSSAHNYQEYYAQQQQQPAQVFKHFYVHSAPEEPEQPKLRQPVVLPAPQKHYKIIFIKTPSAAPAAPQLVPVQQQNEEKTIVYVLVQKPEEAKDIVVPQLEQKPPAKPEVYFIKYNNKEGSQAVINNIVSDLNQGQAVTENNGDGGSVSSSFAQSSASGQSTPSAQEQSQVFVQDNADQFNHHHHHQDEQSNAGSSSTVFNSGASSVNNGGSSVTTVGYQNNEQVAQNVYQAGEEQQQGSQVLSTSQGVPHESYGPPKFRLH